MTATSSFTLSGLQASWKEEFPPDDRIVQPSKDGTDCHDEKVSACWASLSHGSCHRKMPLILSAYSTTEMLSSSIFRKQGVLLCQVPKISTHG